MSSSQNSAPQPAARYARVLSIAGSDSGGGAGIQADLKTFSALGCYGMTAITALTAQNTQGVRGIHSVPCEFLQAQISAVVEDIGVDAVKIGMLHAADVARTVAAALDRYQLDRVVFDPVMTSASGAQLIDNDAIGTLVEQLFPRATLITPNLDEAALLLGRRLDSAASLEDAARELLDMGARAVLLKGGHLPGSDVLDILAWRCDAASEPSQPGGQQIELRLLQAPRIATHNLHGTGCTLSSAITAYLALGLDLVSAVQAARAYVMQALHAGAQVRTGAGVGPLNHGFAPQAMQLR